MSKVIDSTNLGYLIGKMKAAFLPANALEQVGVDATPTADSTNLVESGGVYAFVKPATQSTQPAGGLLPGILYKLGTLTGSVTISLATPSDASVANEYGFTFTAGSTAPTITWPAGVSWAGNCLDSNGVPEITGGNSYEVSILDSKGIMVEWEA